MELLVVAGIVVGVFAVLILLALVLDRRRARRADEAFDSVTHEVRDRALGLLAAAARAEHAVTLHRFDASDAGVVESGSLASLASRIGGIPYAEAGDTWPSANGREIGRFLLQVRLSDPSLGPDWSGRLIQLYRTAGPTVPVVRVHQDPAPERFSPLPPASEIVLCRRLDPLPLPAVAPHPPVPRGEDEEVEDLDEGLSWDPDDLLRTLPELDRLLAATGDRRSDVLARILMPGLRSSTIDDYAVITEGGQPLHVQGEHDARCEVCDEAGRFLLQVGLAGIPDEHAGDSGSVYVYGCDAHPDHTRLFYEFA